MYMSCNNRTVLVVAERLMKHTKKVTFKNFFNITTIRHYIVAEEMRG